MKKRSKRREASIEVLKLAQVSPMTCAWCRKPLGDQEPVIGLGAKARRRADLRPYRGQLIELPLGTADKVILAFVPPPESQAAREGNDLCFMMCSNDCAVALRSRLREEIDLGKAIFSGGAG